MTRQPLLVILRHLPERGRKEIEEIGDEREGQRRKRNRNESEETEEIQEAHGPQRSPELTAVS